MFEDFLTGKTEQALKWARDNNIPVQIIGNYKESNEEQMNLRFERQLNLPFEKSLNQPWFNIGSLIECVNVISGYPYDRKLAMDYLTIGGVYTVKDSNTSDEYSWVELVEFPNVTFNTVYFKQL